MMKTNKFAVNTLFGVVVGLACLGILLLWAFVPDFILPEFNLTMVVALTLIALVLERYLTPKAGRCWVGNILLGVATLGLLPYCAGLAVGPQLTELLLWGGGTFAVTLFLYTSMTRRLSSGPVGKLAPIFSALGLYLAAQCFTGILF